MDVQKFHGIEELIQEHQKLEEAHRFVVSKIDEIKETSLGPLALIEKDELLHKLYQAAGSGHFLPLKEAVRAKLDRFISEKS